MFSKFSGFTKFISIWIFFWGLTFFVYDIVSGFKGFIQYIYLCIFFGIIISSPFLYDKVKIYLPKSSKKIFEILLSLILIFLLISYTKISNSFKITENLNLYNTNKMNIYKQIVDDINKEYYIDATSKIERYKKYNDPNLEYYEKIVKQRKEIFDKKQNIIKQEEEKKKEEERKKQEKEDEKKRNIAKEESIRMEKEADLAILEEEKQLHIQYLKSQENEWKMIIKDDGKTNVSFVIKDMAEAYEGLLELYPDNKQYQKRGKYWIDFNNEEIKHQQNIENVYNSKIKFLRKYLKENMKNPRSLDIVSEKYYDHIDEITIEIIYRATNSYNATITDKMLTRINLHTNEIKYIQLSILDK